MLAMLRGGSVLDGQRSPHAMVPVVDVCAPLAPLLLQLMTLCCC